MGVIRSAYRAWVRFYPGQALTRVQWYFCNPSNPWFMGENIFFPWKEYKQFENTDDLGEITDLPRPWVNGADTGNLDGSIINGDPRGFAGRMPYDPTAPSTCDPPWMCTESASIPSTLYCVITKVTCTIGTPKGHVGDAIPLIRGLPTTPRWTSPGPVGIPSEEPNQFIIACENDNFVFLNEWPFPQQLAFATELEIDPFLAEFKDVPVYSMFPPYDSDEVWDCKIIP